MEALTILFIAAPIISTGILYALYNKDTHDSEHFFHVFSLSYLFFLVLSQIIKSSSSYAQTLLFVVIFLVILFGRNYLGGKNKGEAFSHHHHSVFSYKLVIVFILHSFVDGFLFSFEALQGGLMIHRIIDGFVILGLIGPGTFRMNFWRKPKARDFFIMLAFILAPLFGIFAPGIINSQTVYYIQIILLTILAPLLFLDIYSEFKHRHHVNNKIFYAAILFGVILGIFSLH